MATTTKIDNLNIPADRFKEELQTLTADSDRVIGVVADAEIGRAAKQEAIAARLERKVGKDDPRVLRLRSSVVSHRASGTAHAEAIKRIARLPKRNPEDCAVLGRVFDSSGKPVRKLRVRLTDKARSVDIGGRTATTDEFGEFALVYPKCDFGVVGGTAPEAFLVVEDSRKQALFTSPEPVKVTRGRSAYFEIVLTSTANVLVPRAAPKATAKARKARPRSKSVDSSGGEPETAAKPTRRKATRKARKSKGGSGASTE